MTRSRSSPRALLGSAAALLVLVGTASTAHAVQEDEPNKTVAQISINNIFASVTVNNASSSLNCVHGLIVFSPATAVGRIFYATLLEAQSQNALVDVIYERSGNACTLVGVNMR